MATYKHSWSEWIRRTRLVTTVALALGLVPKAWPESGAPARIQYRVLHLVLRGNSSEHARRLVELAASNGFNAIQFLLTDGVAMDRAPWHPKPNAWTKAQLLEWVRFIRTCGLEPIPEIKLLTHQEKFLAGKHPELLFDSATYDPRNDKVYTVVFAFIDELIESIQPKILHIGHDEVAGFYKAQRSKMAKQGEIPLPASLFYEDVIRIHGYLRKKNVEVWMWGDMLLSPDEFPEMLAKHLHGTLPGYGKPLRDRLPKDIVICDWHYFDPQEDFPSLARLQAEGFRVVAATWKKATTIRNFARYAHAHCAYGLMATTWYSFNHPTYLPLVEWIVRTSGKLFLDPSTAQIDPAPIEP